MEIRTHELTIARTINASLEKVWKAWTDEAEIKKWWGPRGVTNPTCEWQAKPGGKINIIMKAGKSLGEMAGQEWPMSGEFKEVGPKERLVFTTQAIMGGKPILENLCIVTFSEQNGQTLLSIHVSVTKTTSEAEGPLKGMDIGWNQQTDKLIELVEGE